METYLGQGKCRHINKVLISLDGIMVLHFSSYTILPLPLKLNFFNFYFFPLQLVYSVPLNLLKLKYGSSHRGAVVNESD